jgi:hypothetical protein
MQLILSYAIGYLTGVLTAIFILSKSMESIKNESDDDPITGEKDEKTPYIGFFS